MMKKETIEVYRTHDYSIFKRLDGNREVSNSRKEKIKRSIGEVGYVLNPIVVNENMEVIEGQGRLAALKDLNMPVYYVIAEGAKREHCIAMNLSNTNWNVLDFIKSYAELGDENYINFLRARALNPKLTLDELHGVIINRIVSHGYFSRPLKDGTLVFTLKDFYECAPVYEWLSDMDGVISKILGSSRVKRTALAWIVKNTDVDEKRLACKLSKQYPILSPIIDSRPDIFLSELSNIYNKGLSAKKCIYFETEYKKFLKEEAD